MNPWLILLGFVLLAVYLEFGESYESKMNRIYKRTAEDVNWNRDRCRKCGK